MGLQKRITNAATRQLHSMFPGYFQGGTKQDFYRDFGWPEQLTFQHFYAMSQRNGLAAAAVDRTVAKTWESHPWVRETQTEDAGEETGLEADIRRRFASLRFWQALMEADRRSLIGGYSAVVLRIADDQQMDQPAGRVNGLDGLVEVIPAWESQLTVSEWDGDQASPTYGKPSMFQFNEAAIGATGNPRQFRVHPSRVAIWSEDGSIHCQSMLQSGYNDLLDMQKISGAGGEGFWKNAKSAPVLQVSEGSDIRAMADAMGVTPEQVADRMQDAVDGWQTGLDRLLMLQGIEAKTLGITLPSPEHFHRIALQSFAASARMPIKILVGSQSGERASTEDADEWAMTNMARRLNRVVPNIMALLEQMVGLGILPPRDWALDWADLAEAAPSEKLNRATQMAEINAKGGVMGVVFEPEEIRDAAGYEPIKTAVDPFEDDENKDIDQ